MTEDDFEAIEKEMMEENKKQRGKRVLICPVCGHSGMTYYMGLKTGYQYQCKHCDYVGVLVIETEGAKELS